MEETHPTAADVQVEELLLAQVDLEEWSEKTLKQSSQKNECNVCGKRFQKPCLLKRHAVVHSSEKTFQCPMCPKSFTQKSSLQRHSQHNHKGVKAHQCPKCTISFAQKTNLMSHLKCAHPPTSSTPWRTRYACDRCACVYSKLNTLMRHKKQQHHGDNSESERVARLAVSFQDETPVDDADELARNVLNELRKLQGGMLISSEKFTTEKEKQDVTPYENISQATETIVDNSQTDLIDIVDKLNPQLEPRVITVQCIRRSNGIAHYICEFCAKEFRKTYDLIRHRRTHLLEQPYNCEHCNKKCITKSKLEQHKKIHTTASRPVRAKVNNLYVCSICQKVLNSMRQFDEHVDSHSQTHTLLCNCSICGRSFGTLTAFSKHKHKKYDKEFEMLSHLLPSPINISPKLNESGCYTSIKVNGSNTRSKDNLEVPKCSSCQRSFSTKRYLQLHQKIHATHKQFPCAQCVGKKFPTKSRLRRHMLTHNQQRNYKCVYCIKIFKSKEHCKQHMKLHLKALLKDNAEDTNSNFETVKNCRITVQENENSLLLPPQASTPLMQMPSPPKFIELQMLPKYRKLRKHNNITVKTLPSSPPTFKVHHAIATNCCSFCQRLFKKPSDLHRHLRTHTKERPFACDRCSKSFALQSTLKDHQQTHSQLRVTHNCQVCGKTYASKKVLVLHLRLHTGERPFICEHCDQSFRTSGHCKAHLKAAHKQK